MQPAWFGTQFCFLSGSDHFLFTFQAWGCLVWPASLSPVLCERGSALSLGGLREDGPGEILQRNEGTRDGELAVDRVCVRVCVRVWMGVCERECGGK